MSKKSKRQRHKKRQKRAGREGPASSVPVSGLVTTQPIMIPPALAEVDGFQAQVAHDQEHRAMPRASLAVEIHLASASHFFSGLSGDISEGGVFVSTYRPLAVGEAVDLEFSLPGSSSLIHVRGEVRWLREHGADAPRGVGIAFESLEASDRERIHAFCSVRPPLYYDDVG